MLFQLCINTQIADTTCEATNIFMVRLFYCNAWSELPNILGCGTSRKHLEVGIFEIPSQNNELSAITQEARIKVITKDRFVDKGSRRQIQMVSCMFAKKISRLKKLIQIVSAFIFFFYISIQSVNKRIKVLSM